MKVLVVEDALNFSVRQAHHLGHTAGTHGHDALVFAHDIDVVKPLGVGQGVAHVFQIAKRVALTVEIVGGIACLTGDTGGGLQHGKDVV